MPAKRKSSGRKAAGKTVASAMRRRKRGTLRSGKAGKAGRVESRKMAIAIGLSEARKKAQRCRERKSSRRQERKKHKKVPRRLPAATCANRFTSNDCRQKVTLGSGNCRTPLIAYYRARRILPPWAPSPHATLPVSSNIFSEVLSDEAHMDPILPCC
jgi:hypothetical protein